jgi:GWxTD domain-containing protein
VKRYVCLILAAVALFGALAFGQARQKPLSPKDLEPRYAQWLQEEVVYIITPKEREIFLQLRTNRERDIFIDAFWKQRDPTPNTDENEFKDEHYRRIKYANQYYGKDSPQPGWKSDMGRIYIMLGEPKTIERFDNLADIYPLHVWFYEGMAEYGLPNAFYVMFFKKYNAGEYVLYSPIRDGPMGLMPHYAGDQTSFVDAYNELRYRQPDLAPISISLIPGEMTAGITPSMSSDILLANKIPKAPIYKVRDTYAEKLLAYKDIVEVDYTANYIDSEYKVFVYQDPRGGAFIHYLVEPSRLSFDQYGDRYVANLEIDGNITDAKGLFVYQFERRIPIEMNGRQIASIQDKLFSYQDLFPVVPGDYKLSVIMKNRVSKEFTTFECPLKIPGPGTAWMSPVLLANKAERDSKYAAQVKPFLFGGVQLRPSPRNDFLRSDTMTVYLQLNGLSAELRDSGTLELAFVREGEKVKTLTRRLTEIAGLPDVSEEFALAEIPPAYYFLEATLFDGAGQAVVTEKAPFYITPMAGLSRPWVLSLPFVSADSPEIAYILGKQRLNRKELAAALPLLESAYRRVPAEAKYALDLARACSEQKDYARARDICRPFADHPDEPGFLLLLGQSSQALGQTAEAVDFYKTYLNRFGTNVSVLNALGDCHLALGQREEALAAFEKSVEIEPNQPKIKAALAALKEKK